MKRLGWMIGIVLLLSISVMGASAQDIFCGELSVADCDLYTRAQNLPTDTADDATYELGIDITMFGIPGWPEGESIKITAEGAYSGAVDLLNSVPMTGTVTETESVEYLRDLVADLDATLSLRVVLPPTIGIQSGLPTNELLFDLILLDGFGYVDLDALQPLTNDASLTGWGGINLIGLIDSLIGTLRSPAKQQPTTPDFPPELLDLFSDPDTFNQFIDITSGAGSQAGTTQFTVTFELGGFFSDPTVSDFLIQQLVLQGSATGFTMEEINAMIDALFAEPLVIRQLVDVETAETTQVGFDWVIDLTPLGSDLGLLPSQEARIEMSITASAGGEAFAPIEAPAGASILPYQFLLGGF